MSRYAAHQGQVQAGPPTRAFFQISSPGRKETYVNPVHSSARNEHSYRRHIINIRYMRASNSHVNTYTPARSRATRRTQKETFSVIHTPPPYRGRV